jgi:hypothetical protein
VKELEALLAASKALMSLSDRLEDIFSRRMKERAEQATNEPPTWEEELASQMRIADDCARAEGRPLPTNILYGIEEPEEEEDPAAPDPAVTADPERLAPEEAERNREAVRLAAEAALLEAEAKERGKRVRRERLTARDVQVARSIERLPTRMNDADAFLRVRRALRGNTTVYFRRGPDDVVIGAFQRSFLEDVVRISECEAGRRYLVAMSPAFEPWPSVEPPGLNQISIPANPPPTPSVAEQQWHMQRRGRGR